MAETNPKEQRSGRVLFCVDGSRAHTKVVATIGPASEDRVGELIDAGLSVARINMSHGTHDDARRRIEAVRRAADERRTAVGILADIQGPKMRLGCFAGGSLELREGERYRLAEGKDESASGEVLFNLDGFTVSVKVGDRIFLNDGAVQVEVVELHKGYNVGRVTRGGVIGDRKGVHLPDSSLRIDLPTSKDREDLAFLNEVGVDMIGVSFVSGALDLRRVRELAPEALLVAKIERRIALERIDEILAETDGIMVARGDLGVETALEELPLVQKSLLSAALRAGRFAITATEMLESMVEASRPTRAEVADVASAVLDGTDALMLSAETAVGRYPVEAVRTMIRIAESMERSQSYHDLPRVAFRQREPTFSNAVAMAACHAAEALGISKIVCFTETGNTVRLLSRYRPFAEVIALTPHKRTLNAMAVLAHVRPLLHPRLPSLERMLASASTELLERGLVHDGEEVVMVAGVPPGVARSTNVVKLHRIGEPVALA